MKRTLSKAPTEITKLLKLSSTSYPLLDRALHRLSTPRKQETPLRIDIPTGKTDCCFAVVWDFFGSKMCAEIRRLYMAFFTEV